MQSTETLIQTLEPIVQPLGYEIVHVEIQTHRQKTLRVFIARTDGKGVGIEDCVTVTKALDGPLDNDSTVSSMFSGGYELEVSSPGLDRPLRTEKDFRTFAGNRVRIHTFRPLQESEIGDAEYLSKNPRQKNFLGLLLGIGPQGVSLKVDQKTVSIPLNLVSKASLDPEFAFDSKESE